MARFKKHLLVAIGFTLAGMIGAAFGTRTAEAVVATLVEMVNTTANPAVTVDADKSTRLPYQSTKQFMWTSPLPGIVEMLFTPVPAGHRLVTTNVSAFLWISSGTPYGSIFTSFNKTQGFPSFTGVYDGNGSGVINQMVTRYVGAGDTPLVFFYANYAVTGLGTINTVTLTGYLEDCAVTGCPAITE